MGVLSDAVLPYGDNRAKIDPAYVETLEDKPDGKLIRVTVITPTPTGQGKIATPVGLNDGSNRIGKKAVACLREPSRGPCFGMKGGAMGERSVDSGTI